MKVFKKVALLSVGLMAAVAGLGACKSNAKMPVNFVAVTSSDYNATVTFGDYDYKFQAKINQNSSNFTLNGIVAQRHMTASQGGGMGGFPGGGFPGGGPGGNSSGPGFEGFGAGEEQPGEQPGENPGMPGMPGSSENPGEQPGENPGMPGMPGSSENPGEGSSENPGMPGMPGEGSSEEPGEGSSEDPGQGGFNPGGQQGGQQQQNNDPIQALALNLSLSEAFINQAVTASVTYTPETSSGSDVVWSSSDEKVATVNNGSVSPIAEGKTTITVTSKADANIKASAELTVKKENLEQYNWSVNGTCTYEKGYGYKIVFDDEGKTEVHTDFDKTEGRHEFYYRVKIGETSSVLKFQAKDPTFKDQLAKDYKKWDERDSKYIFYAKATGNNNSVATAYIYLHETNNEVTVNTPNGANRSLSFGMKWEEKDGVITVKDGETAYVADKSVNSEHPGYRLVYGGNTYYCSLNPEVKWKKMTIADFEGQNIHEFVGSYTTSGPDGGVKEVNLNCVEDGKAKLYLGSSTASFVGTWSKDASNKLTIELDGKTGEFTPGADGKYSIVIRVTISSFFGSSTETIALTQAK